MGTPFLHKLDRKIVTFRSFSKNFNIFNWKPAKKNQIGCGLVVIRVFFHILIGDYLLKQEAVVVKPPESKFMAIS